MISTVIRTALLYLFVTFAIRIMGKRQIGDMQPNELVITLLISEIAAIPLQDANQPILNGVAAICVLVVFEISVSLLVMKSPFIRRALYGKSAIIIKNGKIDKNAMERVRMTIPDLLEMLREKDVFDIGEVAFAVLEVNGELSVLPKSSERPATAKQSGIKVNKESFLLPVISDGQIIKETLSLFNISEKEVEKELKKQNVKKENLLLMTVDQDGKFNICK